jgi:hypothetical protein
MNPKRFPEGSMTSDGNAVTEAFGNASSTEKVADVETSGAIRISVEATATSIVLTHCSRIISSVSTTRKFCTEPAFRVT